MAIKKSRSSIEVTDRMSPKERERYLNARLKELVAYAYKKAPTTKARFDNR